jgi:hypothetical protein
MPTFAGRGALHGQHNGSPRPLISVSRPEPLLFHSSSSVILTRLSGPCSRPPTSQKRGFQNVNIDKTALLQYQHVWSMRMCAQVSWCLVVDLGLTVVQTGHLDVLLEFWWNKSSIKEGWLYKWTGRRVQYKYVILAFRIYPHHSPKVFQYLSTTYICHLTTYALPSSMQLVLTN